TWTSKFTVETGVEIDLSGAFSSTTNAKIDAIDLKIAKATIQEEIKSSVEAKYHSQQRTTTEATFVVTIVVPPRGKRSYLVVWKQLYRSGAVTRGSISLPVKDYDQTV